MAMEAKLSFLREAESDLSVFLPANDMSRVLSALSDRLQMYDLSVSPTAFRDTDDLLQTYLDARAVQGYSPRTLDLYARYITRLRNALNVPTRSITVHHLRKYLAAERPAACRMVRSATSGMFTMLISDGYGASA